MILTDIRRGLGRFRWHENPSVPISGICSIRSLLIRCSLFSLFILLTGSARADAEVMYLANAGLMITDGESKILFDPLFRNNFGQYQLLPLEMEAALMAGVEPFAGVDAVFVSHFHGDHFSPQDVLNYLRRNEDVLLYAPMQATEALYHFTNDADSAILGRVTGLDIDYGDKAMSLSVGALAIEAFHIPHSGWPERKPEVQNVAFRVTLNDSVTVLHMGDADARDAHFANDADLWAARQIDAAFPPYWFFTSDKGGRVLANRIRPAMAVGVHVPQVLPPEYSAGLDQRDLFRTPGETRRITIKD